MKLDLRIDGGRPRRFHVAPSSHAEHVNLTEDTATWDLPDDARVYLRLDGLFDLTRPPRHGFVLRSATPHIASAAVWTDGERPSLWILQFDERRRVGEHRVTLKSGNLISRFDTTPEQLTSSLAIRLTGRGSLTLRDVRIDTERLGSSNSVPTAPARITPLTFAPSFELPSAPDAAGLHVGRRTFDAAEPPWDDERWTSAEAWRLHAWFPIAELAQRGDDIASVGSFVRSWIEADRQDRLGPFGWYQHSVASRAVTLASLLSDDDVARTGIEREELVRLQVRHAHRLADPERYERAHNHGLFIDYGLYTAARSLVHHPDAVHWESTARRRFDHTLGLTVDMDENMHLEHSPEYQLIVADLIRAAEQVGLLGSPMSGLGDRMRSQGEAAFADPSGQLVPFGDTAAIGVPTTPARPTERVFENSGYATVRDDTIDLFVTSAYHGLAHNHVDLTSFVLWIDRQAVVVDAGNPGYDYRGSSRQFAESPSAHNVALVEGDEQPWRSHPPTGSTIVGHASTPAAFAIHMTNPQLTVIGAPTERVLLYRRGRGLSVIDIDPSGRPMTTYLHFAPEVELSPEGNRHLVSIAGQIVASVEHIGSADCTESIVAGQQDPLQGVVFDGGSRQMAAPVLVVSRSQGELTAAHVAIGDGPALDGVTHTDHGSGNWTLGLEYADATVTVRRNGGALEIS